MSTPLKAERTKAHAFGTAGLRIGKFKLLDIIGAGGFGEVWRAQEEIEGQPVGLPCAIKLMRVAARTTRSSEHEPLQAAWIQEINALKSITHDAIPRIFDGGIDEGTGLAFIAMELLEGETLAQRISRQRLGWRRASMIAERIANALDAAHARGIVHRDLKPQNVILVRNGGVCVIDWGIATLGGGSNVATELPARRDDTDGDDTGTKDISTREQRKLALQNRPTGPRIVGTPGYIAPELYEGAEPAPAVDAFALGVVLYQCLTGRLPHRLSGTNAATSSWAGATEASRASSVDIWKATTEGSLNDIGEFVASIPTGVRALIGKLLSTIPEERGAGALASMISHTNFFPAGVPDPPYAGLDAFGMDRAGFLFGRDAHIDRIVKRLEQNHVVVLSGPSGCGKSSLAVAGVASRIDRVLLDGTDGWRSLVIRPSEPRALQLISPGQAIAATKLEPPLGTVVVVDQLEEVLGLDGEQQSAFCRALAALAERTQDVMVRGERITRDNPIRLIATVREDFEWQVVRIEALRNLCETSRFLVTGVDASASRELVEEPAKALGYRLENGDKVIREVEALLATDPTALPIVQFSLSEWWVRRDKQNQMLPAKAWGALGGVEGALSYVADRHYRGLPESDQQALRVLFGRLLLGDRKQWVSAASLGHDQERRLMDQLTELRLVRRRDEGENRVGYELAHESLARRWDVLQQWIKEREAEDALIADLEIEAKLWERQKRPANRLRPDIVVALAVRERLGAVALQYVDASMEAGRAAILAEQEAKRTVELATQAARRRQYVTTVAVSLMVIAAAVGYAVQIGRKEAETSAALGRVEEEKKAAEQARADANKERDKAILAEKKANDAAKQEEGAKKVAEKERNQRIADFDALEKRIAEAKTTKELEQIRQEIATKRNVDTQPISTGFVNLKKPPPGGEPP